MNPSRKPHDAQASRMSALARLPVFLSLDGKRAVLAGGNPAAAWKAELLSAAGAQVNVYASEMSDDMRQLAADVSRGAITLHRTQLVVRKISPGAADRGRRVRRRRGGGRVCGGRARCRRAGQRDRQAGVLRFFLRRHRQSLAAGHRNFDRRRGAGLCPGDPRQARGAAAERLRGLGRRCRALARCAEACRAVFRGAAQILADLHRPCGRRSRPRAGRRPTSTASLPK